MAAAAADREGGEAAAAELRGRLDAAMAALSQLAVMLGASQVGCRRAGTHPRAGGRTG